MPSFSLNMSRTGRLPHFITFTCALLLLLFYFGSRLRVKRSMAFETSADWALLDSSLCTQTSDTVVLFFFRAAAPSAVPEFDWFRFCCLRAPRLIAIRKTTGGVTFCSASFCSAPSSPHFREEQARLADLAAGDISLTSFPCRRVTVTVWLVAARWSLWRGRCWHKVKVTVELPVKRLFFFWCVAKEKDTRHTSDSNSKSIETINDRDMRGAPKSCEKAKPLSAGVTAGCREYLWKLCVGKYNIPLCCVSRCFEALHRSASWFFFVRRCALLLEQQHGYLFG